MLELRELDLKDREWIQDILKKCGYMSCEYSFGNHFIWKNAYNIKVARLNDYYTAMFSYNDGSISFLYPAGIGDIKPIIQEIMDYCNDNSLALKLNGLTEDRMEELKNLFPGKFKITPERDLADYIYKSENLINLGGKKYHGKRNHIKRFKENDWSFEPITKDNIKECMIMNSKWCVQNNCGDDEAKRQECCAVKRSFKYFDELGFFGGLLRVDAEVVAFTIGEKLNDNTVVVHIEKAFSDIQGAYPTINREFVAQMASEYEFVNREEDMGIEGLRKAKLSYQPEIILTKCSVVLA